MKIKKRVTFQELIGKQYKYSPKTTYIIEGDKDNFGEALTEFVQKNFGWKWNKFVIVEREDILPNDIYEKEKEIPL